MRLRRRTPDLEVGPGERILAWATSPDGVVAGTRDALYVPAGRLPWEQVEAADWQSEDGVLTVSEVGTWGEVRPVHRLVLEEAALLLDLVRERVTASIVLQRHVAVRGKAGVRVIARRAPRRDGEITWLFEYDAGVDPADPEVAAAADAALAAARGEVGLR